MQALRCLGYKRDCFDHRDRPIAAHPSIGNTALLPGVDLRSFADPAESQFGTSDCVNFALAFGFDIRARIQGLGIPRTSRSAIYKLARPLPLVDDGCRPRDALLAARQYGLISEDRVPFSEADIDTQLPWDALEHGSDARAAEFWRIDSEGVDRCTQIMQALSGGFPVAFAQPVDHAFDNYRSGQVLNAFTEGDRGGHYTVIVGYREDGVFIALNSWGREFGDDGYYLIGPERIGDPRCTDFWVLEACSPGVS